MLFEAFTSCGLAEELFPAVSVIVDKIDKIDTDGVRALLKDAGIADEISEKILRVMSITALEELEGILGFRPQAIDEVQGLLRGAEEHGIAPFLKYHPGLVRGLSYYTGTVFEVFEAGGIGRAICGGGRYDRLMETVGGSPIPMVGFGFGDVVIADILEERGLFPDFSSKRKILIAAFSEEQRAVVLRALSGLRGQGICCEPDLSYRKPKKLFARAHREGFSHVILAGPEEVARGEMTVKTMTGGHQESVPIEELGLRILQSE